MPAQPLERIKKSLNLAPFQRCKEVLSVFGALAEELVLFNFDQRSSDGSRKLRLYRFFPPCS